MTLKMEPCFRRKQQSTVYLALALLSCVWANEQTSQTVNSKVGAAVTLEAGNATEDQILWTFGATVPNIRIVKMSFSKIEVVSKELEGRLQLDIRTGSLTITNLTNKDSGVYQWQCIGSNISSRRYILRVYSSVGPPSIKNVQYGNCCLLSVECSINNSKDLTLSWFKERDRLETITNSVHSSPTKLSLSVEVEYHDQSSYSCVAENPVDTQTTLFHPAGTCLKKGESSSWCQSGGTVRLVFSAVIGLVLIILVVDHFRIRK